MSNITTTFSDYINENKINKVLYHGSYTSGLKELKPYTNNINSIPPSIFLTNKIRVAKDYGDNIYKCRLVCNNIKEINLHGESFHNYYQFENNIINAHDEGYDCIVFRNIMDSREPNTKVPLSDIYVVFDSNNIIITDSIY